MQSSLWFRSAKWDCFWLQSAYWIFPLFSLVFFIEGMAAIGLAIAIIFCLIRLAHGYFAGYICLFNKEYREVGKKKPFHFYVIPGLIVLVSIILFTLPMSILPYTIVERVRFYYFVGFPYIYVHYAFQHIGIFSMYRSRAGQRLSDFHKSFERIYSHVVVGFILTALNLENYYDPEFGSIKYKSLFYTDSISYELIAWGVIIPMTLLFVYLELKADKRSWPKIFYGVSISLMSLVLSFESLIYGWVLLHMQHYLSHFGLAGHYLNNLEAKDKTQGLSMNRLLKIYIGFAAFSIGLSLIHYHFTAIGTETGRYDLILANLIPRAPEDNMIRLTFLGLFVGMSLNHYYFDRLAFKFRDPDIGKILKENLLKIS